MNAPAKLTAAYSTQFSWLRVIIGALVALLLSSAWLQANNWLFLAAPPPNPVMVVLTLPLVAMFVGPPAFFLSLLAEVLQRICTNAAFIVVGAGFGAALGYPLALASAFASAPQMCAGGVVGTVTACLLRWLWLRAKAKPVAR